MPTISLGSFAHVPRDATLARLVRCVLAAICVAGCLAGPVQIARAAAPGAPGSAPSDGAPMGGAPDNAGAPGASAVKSGERATTFKILTATSNLALFSGATGSLLGGGMISAALTAGSWTIYAVNDYLWDRFYPVPVTENAAGGFDTNASAWRTTLKFMTYKPAGYIQKVGVVYLFTGSPAAALTYGTISSFINAAEFYVNNTGWDYYDWWKTTPAGGASAL